MRSSRRRVVAALLPVAAVLLLAAVPPRPATVVGELADPDGTVQVTPALVSVPVARGEGAAIGLRFANGTSAPVALALTAEDVVSDATGAPRPAGAVSGPASWLAFAERSIVVPAGTVVDLGAAVNVPDDAPLPAVVAVRARLSDDDDVVAFIALDPPGGSASLAAEVDTEGQASTETVLTDITNDGDAAAVAVVTTHVRAWHGRRLIAVTSGPLLVPAGERRTVRTSFRSPSVPGPYTVQVVVRAGDTVVRAAGDGMLWNPAASAALVATALLGLTAAAWVRTRRSVRAGGAATGPEVAGSGPPGEATRRDGRASAADEPPEA